MAQMVRQQIDTNGMYRNQGVVLISGDTNRSLPFLPVKIYPLLDCLEASLCLVPLALCSSPQ